MSYLTGITHMPITSPTTVAALLISAQLLFMDLGCSPVSSLSSCFLAFHFITIAVLMDVSLGILYKLFYYCMFLLYELSLSLYSIHSRVYSSLKDCFYPQLKAHCKTDSHPSHGYHHRTDILMMISIHCYHRHLYFYKPRQNSFTSASVSFGFVFQDLLYTHEELL